MGAFSAGYFWVFGLPLSQESQSEFLFWVFAIGLPVEEAIVMVCFNDQQTVYALIMPAVPMPQEQIFEYQVRLSHSKMIAIFLKYIHHNYYRIFSSIVFITMIYNILGEFSQEWRYSLCYWHAYQC